MMQARLQRIPTTASGPVVFHCESKTKPSFQPVGIKLRVSEPEAETHDPAFEMSDVAFGPVHPPAQQITSQDPGLCHDFTVPIQYFDETLTASRVDVGKQPRARYCE